MEVLDGSPIRQAFLTALCRPICFCEWQRILGFHREGFSTRVRQHSSARMAGGSSAGEAISGAR